jgi:Fe-S-cluster containining protein
VSLGFKEDIFAVEFRGFKKLRNNKGRCIFHNGEQCTIYPARRETSKLYLRLIGERQVGTNEKKSVVKI